ncbi:MAG: hypothetical protein NT027_04870, partial [Proteobacteria bacterium]|nr:hypothetical protein [Pseudomonadota bacterium]
MKNKAFQFLPAVIGIIYFLLSGRAEGFASLRTMLIFPILLSNIYLFAMLLKIVLSYLRIGKKKKKKSDFSAIVAVLILDALVLFGLQRDQLAIAESKVRGDKIIDEIMKFDSINHRLPRDLRELTESGFTLPQPALINSEFSYSFGEDK